MSVDFTDPDPIRCSEDAPDSPQPTDSLQPTAELDALFERLMAPKIEYMEVPEEEYEDEYISTDFLDWFEPTLARINEEASNTTVDPSPEQQSIIISPKKNDS